MGAACQSACGVRSALLAAGVALLGVGCEVAPPPEPGVSRVLRLVDAEWRLRGEVRPGSLMRERPAPFPGLGDAQQAAAPSATIGDSTRPVMATYEQLALLYRTPIDPPENGRSRMEVGVGDAFPGASRLLLAPTLFDGTRSWRRLPARHVTVVKRDGWRHAWLELDGLEAESDDLRVSVVAYRPAPDGETLLITPPLEIAPGTRLDVAFAVLEAAGDAAVHFAIEACAGEACTPLLDEELAAAPSGSPRWEERTVSLDAVAGSRRSFRFATRYDPAHGAALPLWADPALLIPEPGATPPTNLILLSIDTLGRDHLDLYGYERETAPYLRSEFAPGGVVFENLVSEAASTAPSHMTIFTSLPSLVHGVASRLTSLAVPVTTLADVLRGAGYRTAAFNENGPLAQGRGFAQGFDRYDENKSATLLKPSGQVDRTFEQARRWIAANTDAPFFVFLHTFQVHAPYEPPDAYAAYFAVKERPPFPQRLADDYDREIRYVDDELARLVQAVDAMGLGERTLWVVLSDHGEAFMEHGVVGHGSLPYDEIVRVPLIVRGPGVAAGRRVETPLHHLDLMPTLLDHLGVPAPPGLIGRSLAAELRGEAGSAVAERPRFSVSWALPDGMTPPALSVRRGGLKLIRYRENGQEHVRLYDLGADPGEERDLASDRPADTAALSNLLDVFEEESLRSRETRAAGRTRAEPLLDPEREEKLRALGYIE